MFVPSDTHRDVPAFTKVGSLLLLYWKKNQTKNDQKPSKNYQTENRDIDIGFPFLIKKWNIWINWSRPKPLCPRPVLSKLSTVLLLFRPQGHFRPLCKSSGDITATPELKPGLSVPKLPCGSNPQLLWLLKLFLGPQKESKVPSFIFWGENTSRSILPGIQSGIWTSTAKVWTEVLNEISFAFFKEKRKG